MWSQAIYRCAMITVALLTASLFLLTTTKQLAESRNGGLATGWQKSDAGWNPHRSSVVGPRARENSATPIPTPIHYR
jgi:hypothetical protein